MCDDVTNHFSSTKPINDLYFQKVTDVQPISVEQLFKKVFNYRDAAFKASVLKCLLDTIDNYAQLYVKNEAYKAIFEPFLSDLTALSQCPLPTKISDV